MRTTFFNPFFFSLIFVACGGDEAQTTSPGGTGGSAETGGRGGGTGGRGGGTGGRGAGGTGGVQAGGAGAGTGGTSSGGAPEAGVEAGLGGAGGRDGGPDASDASKPALVVSDVHTLVTENGVVADPVDLSGYDLAVLVYDAQKKTFSNHPPTLTEPGSFKVDVLPPGDRYVRLTRLGLLPFYMVTTADTLDAGVAGMGRPNVVAASAGTTLSLNVSNMESWQAEDYLEIFSLGIAAYSFDIANAPAGAPGVGDTSLTGLTVDFAAAGGNLVDGSLGDRVHLMQLSPRSLGGGGGTYTALARIYSIPSFSMTDGQTTAVSGAFVTPPAATLDVDWKTSQFDAAALQGNPGTTVTLRVFTVTAEPHPELGSYASTPDLVEYIAPDSTDIVTTFSYGNPFTPQWTLFTKAGVTFVRSYALPSTQPARVNGRIAALDRAPGAVTSTTLLTCVQNLKIAGKDALADVTGVGTSPTITFDAPANGTPSGYELNFFRLQDVGGTTTRTAAGTIMTAGRSVVVPPGIMTAGNSYMAIVRARARGGVDMNVAPRMTAFPEGLADVLTGIISP